MEAPTSRIPPQNIQAEKAVLCCCLLNTNSLSLACKALNPKDFYIPAHEMIFASMQFMSAQRESVDIVTVSDFLEKKRRLVEIGGTAYISSLSDERAMCSNTPEYVEMVRSASERRKIITTLDSALSDSYRGETDPLNIIDTTVIKLKKNRTNAEESGLLDIADYYPTNETSYYIPTGFESLDYLTDGFSGGMYTVITGKRGTGKSTFASQLALSAIDSGYPVCFYSGELSKKMFLEWTLCQSAGQNNVVEYYGENGARRFKASRESEVRIRNWLRGKLILYDNGVRKSNEHNTIVDRFTEAATNRGCKLFFVDNLKSARFKESTERDFYRKQAMFVQDLLEFALEFNVHVVLMVHPSKAITDDINDGIAGSSDITDLASNIFRIDRLEGGERMKEGADAMITVSKNRDLGTVARIPLMYDTASRRYTNRDGKTKTHYQWEENK